LAFFASLRFIQGLAGERLLKKKLQQIVPEYTPQETECALQCPSRFEKPAPRFPSGLAQRGRMPILMKDGMQVLNRQDAKHAKKQ
jgi:hypothetical protein